MCELIINFFKSFSKSDIIQLFLAFTTFFAVIVAMFNERFWRWKDRPKIDVIFDENNERCFRPAYVPLDGIMDDGRFRDVLRQYYRLKVTNAGGSALKLKARLEILDTKNNQLERFDPTPLNWVTGGATIDLAKGESEYINLISQVLIHDGLPVGNLKVRKVKNRIRVEAADTSLRGISLDRKIDTYTFEVTIFGDNIKPSLYRFKYTPSDNDETPGKLTQELKG